MNCDRSTYIFLWKILASYKPNCSLSYSGFFHMHDLGVSYTSVIFLRNDVLILNGKENKEASAICFEIRIPKKNNEELLREVPSKIYQFVNISKFHHRTM